MNLQGDSKIVEVRSLTGLRGVAALYVIGFHYFQPLPLTTPVFCFLGHGYLAVDVFFPLSGFVMAMNYSNRLSVRLSRAEVKLFISRRIARILPLYLFALLAATILVACHQLEFRGESLPATFLANLFLIQNWGFWESVDVPTWSISAEWFAYMLFPLLLPSVFSKGKLRSLAVAGVCLAGLVALYAHGLKVQDAEKTFDYTHGPLSLARCVCEFTLGMLAFRISHMPPVRKLRDSPWLCYVLVAVVVVLLSIKRTDLALAMLFPLVILTLTGRPNLISRLLASRRIEYLGLLSFSFYLLHLLLVPLLNRVDSFVHDRGHSHSHTYGAAAALLVLFPLSMLGYNYIEMPGRAWLRAVLESKR